MKNLVICATLLLSTVAYAQQQPTPPQQPDFVLKVTPAELTIISDGLQTQPFGKVMPLLNKLQQQINEQTKPTPAEAPK